MISSLREEPINLDGISSTPHSLMRVAISQTTISLLTPTTSLRLSLLSANGLTKLMATKILSNSNRSKRMDSRDIKKLMDYPQL